MAATKKNNKGNSKTNNKADFVWGLSRIGLGLVFLWAFLDKMFGLGFATCRDQAGEVAIMCEKAVVNGGSPTEGFLKFGTSGPFADFYQSLAGNGLVDLMFLAALLGLGVALLLGIGMRIATLSGVLLLMMMWSATLLPDNNPLIDDHVIYSIVLVGLLLVNDKQKLGFGSQWAQTNLVKKYPILR